MIRKIYFSFSLLFIVFINVYSQNVGIGTNTPNASAQLDISSNSKGVLIPRLTQTQRNAVTSPAAGLLIYQTDNTPGFYYYNSSAWTELSNSSASLTLPYTRSQAAVASALFSLTNSSATGANSAIQGNNASTDGAATALQGTMTATSPVGNSAAVRGIHKGNSFYGIGVWGSHDGGGYGVYGNTVSGTGVYGYGSGSGYGIYGSSFSGVPARFEVVAAPNSSNVLEVATAGTGSAGLFEISTLTNNATLLNLTNKGLGKGIDLQLANTSNTKAALNIANNGTGAGIDVTSRYGNAIRATVAYTGSISVYGTNTTGEAIVGICRGGNGVGAVVGRNDSSGYGVRGYNTKDGIGILGQSGISGGTGIAGRFENINSVNSTPVLQAAGNGTGVTLYVSNSNAGAVDLAIFAKGGVGNVARINFAGKGFFNGGTQNSGADIAEAFDVSGNRSSYEPGDVLAIDTDRDRTVTKSQSAYSSLVVGVYATKPGVLLTEENIDSDISDKVPMGVTGVIPTKVCPQGGAIKRGDLLVSSSIPGVAMKADINLIKPGQVIGKALQEYDGNAVGKINVLVNVK